MTELYHQIGESKNMHFRNISRIDQHRHYSIVSSIICITWFRNDRVPIVWNFFLLAELNDIKYSAYRTAMKLRCIQKASSRELLILYRRCHFTIYFFLTELFPFVPSSSPLQWKSSHSQLCLQLKVYMTWKIFSAYLKGLSKYRRMAFFFSKYLYSFQRYWRFCIMQIRSVMTS